MFSYISYINKDLYNKITPDDLSQRLLLELAKRTIEDMLIKAYSKEDYNMVDSLGIICNMLENESEEFVYDPLTATKDEFTYIIEQCFYNNLPKVEELYNKCINLFNESDSSISFEEFVDNLRLQSLM